MRQPDNSPLIEPWMETFPMNITLPIVGARFRPPADEILRLLPSGIPLMLRPQPDNPYDANAIAVLLPLEDARLEVPRNLILASGGEIEGPFHLGFIPAKDAAHISLTSDAHGALTFSLSGGPMVSFTDPTPPEVV